MPREGTALARIRMNRSPPLTPSLVCVCVARTQPDAGTGNSAGADLRRRSAKRFLVHHKARVDERAWAPVPRPVHAARLPYGVRVVPVVQEPPAHEPWPRWGGWGVQREAFSGRARAQEAHALAASTQLGPRAPFCRRGGPLNARERAAGSPGVRGAAERGERQRGELEAGVRLRERGGARIHVASALRVRHLPPGLQS